MQNVEYKSELRDPDLCRALLARAGARRIDRFEQVDTYFRVAEGRLKRRETPGLPVQYIRYDRANRLAPKISRYELFTEEEALARFGAAALPVWLVVRKARELWLLANMRVHLDEVEGLGNFFEIEALVSPDYNLARCHEGIDQLRGALGVALGEPIDGSYSDMIERHGA